MGDSWWQVGVGIIDVGGGAAWGQTSGCPIAVGIGNYGLGVAVGIGNQDIDVGQVGFPGILSAIAICVEIYVSGDGGGFEVTIVTRTRSRTSDRCNCSGVGAFGLGDSWWQVGVGIIDVGGGAAWGQTSGCPIAVGIGNYGLGVAVGIGNQDIDVGQVGFPDILSAIAICVEIDVSGDGGCLTEVVGIIWGDSD